MKLFLMPGACSLATHIVLEWVGVPYTTQALTHEETKGPEFLARNPMGAVPALEVDGQILTQNNAILHYLAETNPAAGLLGQNALERAEVNRWLGFVNSDIHPTFRPLFGATAFLKDEATIEKTKTQARERLRQLFTLADQQLTGREWIAGNRSLADPYLFVVTNWAHMTGVDLAGLDNLQRYFDRMMADPGVTTAMTAEGLR